MGHRGREPLAETPHLSCARVQEGGQHRYPWVWRVRSAEEDTATMILVPVHVTVRQQIR